MIYLALAVFCCFMGIMVILTIDQDDNYIY